VGEIVPVVPKDLGNTITKSSKQIVPSKRWCFTLNNYTKENIKFLSSKIQSIASRGFFSKEVGANGTPHLQGYVELLKKGRPLSSSLFGKLDKIHWEKAKGSLMENMEYCEKESEFEFVYGSLPKPIYCPSIYGWQEKVLKDYILEEIDSRKIQWLWEPEGNFGKSSFVRYCVIKHNALICSGKLADLKYLIIKYHEKHSVYPELILFDIPRTNLNYISYQGLEEIKNGVFRSTKYECETVIMNYPRVLCFANDEPDMSKLSEDRYEIMNVRNL
jgi:hypothetical protein